MRVAASGLICSTPSLANIAVSAANSADTSAETCHDAIGTPNPHKVRHLGAEAIDPKVATDYFHGELGEPRQGAERPTSA